MNQTIQKLDNRGMLSLEEWWKEYEPTVNNTSYDRLGVDSFIPRVEKEDKELHELFEEIEELDDDDKSEEEE